MKYILQIIGIFLLFPLWSQESRQLAIGQPDAIVDLRTEKGIQLVKTDWRYKHAEIVKADFRAPGPSGEDALLLYPTGKKIKTYDLKPKAGVAGYDDSNWEIIAPTSLEKRRGPGLLSFCWYRLNLTIPEKVGDLHTKGATIVFEIVVDDYSEVWVNGKLNKQFGQAGSGVISGFNTRQRVFLTKNAQVGEQFQIAIFAANGPLSHLPDNYIWIRSA